MKLLFFVLGKNCLVSLPDWSFWHLPIFHPSGGGREGESGGGGGRQGRGGGGGGRHGDHGGGRGRGRAEGGDGDLLGLRGVFSAVWTEKHAAAAAAATTVIGSAAPAAQDRHTAPVEAVSDALVGAALEERALRGHGSGKRRSESEGELLSRRGCGTRNRCSPTSRRIHSRDSSDAAPCVNGGRRRAP